MEGRLATSAFALNGGLRWHSPSLQIAWLTTHSRLSCPADGTKHRPFLCRGNQRMKSGLNGGPHCASTDSAFGMLNSTL